MPCCSCCRRHRVTKSDIEIWHHHIAPIDGASRARLVVLNKIDGLWDELKTQAEIDAEIAKRPPAARRCSICRSTRFTRCRRKKPGGQSARGCRSAGEKSFAELEAALTLELIPCKQALVSESSQLVVEDVVVKTTELLETRLAAIQDQVDELEGLRGKNRGVIQGMMIKANEDKEQFERGLQQFNALRNVFASRLPFCAAIWACPLEKGSQQVRQAMEKAISPRVCAGQWDSSSARLTPI